VGKTLRSVTPRVGLVFFGVNDLNSNEILWMMFCPKSLDSWRESANLVIPGDELDCLPGIEVHVS
jgi:hypothetical protein